MCKIISASLTVALAISIACIVDSYHKIDEGNVGIYFKYGALQDRVTYPGVHFLLPFVEDYKEVKIRPETFSVDSVLAITKDGIENTFREITTITTVRKDKIIRMVRKFGMDFKKTLVFDRIKEELRYNLVKKNHNNPSEYFAQTTQLMRYITPCSWILWKL